MIVLTLFTSFPLFAQEPLSLQKAISLALEKNFDVQTSRLTLQQNILNNSAGEAGMLPSLALQGTVNKNKNDLQQDLADGRIIDRNGVSSTLTNGTATVTWTLFDGMVMFARKDRLSSIEEESRLALKLQMENTVEQVIAAYFAVRVLEDQKDAIRQLLKVDSVRLSISQMRLEAGNGSKPDVLQAGLARNTHIAQWKENNTLLESQKENLNVLLGREPSFDFISVDSISIRELDLPESHRSSDVNIMLARQKKNTAFQMLKESKGSRLPVLLFNADYGYSRSESDAGFLLRNQNLGAGYGFQLRWNLFNGFQSNRLIKNAQLETQRAEFNENESFLIRLQDERKSLREYRDHLDLMRIEQESYQMATENLSLSLERLRAGLANALEIQEAQRSFQEAVAALSSVKYRAKLSETKVLRLRSELINGE